MYNVHTYIIVVPYDIAKFQASIHLRTVAVSYHVLFNLKIQRRFHASDAMLLVVTLRKLVFFLSSLHHSRHASCYALGLAVRFGSKSGHNFVVHLMVIYVHF